MDNEDDDDYDDDNVDDGDVEDDDDDVNDVDDASRGEWQASRVAVSLYVRGQFELIGGALVTDNNSFKKHFKWDNSYIQTQFE